MGILRARFDLAPEAELAPSEPIVLSLDFKISKGCNSGIFVRTFPLKRPLDINCD